MGSHKMHLPGRGFKDHSYGDCFANILILALSATLTSHYLVLSLLGTRLMLEHVVSVFIAVGTVVILAIESEPGPVCSDDVCVNLHIRVHLYVCVWWW